MKNIFPVIGIIPGLVFVFGIILYNLGLDIWKKFKK